MKTRNDRELGRWVGLAAVLCAALLTAGCGGGDLIPRDLKDYVSDALKTPRRNVDVTLPFRTTITLRVNPMTIEEARAAERELISKCVEYFRRDGIHNFLNDTLMFVVRLDIDPDVNLKWTSVAGDMKEMLEGKMAMEDFYARCRQEESWSEE